MIARLRAGARRLKREALALWVAARDRRTPLSARVVAWSVAAYAFSPIDLIPDVIPVLGQLDDLLIVPLGAMLAIRLIPPPLMAEFRARAEALAARPRSLAGLAAVFVLWALAAAALALALGAVAGETGAGYLLPRTAAGDAAMLIFVGLGNPGREYAKHRHNIGFMAVDRIAEDHGFGPWRAKFQGEVAEGRLGDEKVLLLKPGTYMNLSGQSVGAAMQFYKIPVGDVVVLHDELDLAPGKCRVKRGGGHAGHNGLRSIHQHCGPDYARVRLGIGHPGRKELVSGYVLHDFSKYDEQWLDDLLRGVSDGAPKLAAGDDGGFMNAVALRTQPPKPKKGKAPAPAAEPPAPPEPEAPAEPEGLSPLEKLKRRFS